MTNGVKQPRALVWCAPARAAVVRDALGRCGVRVVAAGCSEAGRAAEAAGKLGGADSPQVFDDLRAALHRAEVDLVVLADPGDFAAGGHDPDDVAAITAARQRGARVLTLEPMPSSLLQRVQESADEVAADASGEGAHGGGLAEDFAEAGVSLGQGEDVVAEPRLGTVLKTGQAAGLETGGGWARFAPLFRLSGPMRSASDLLEPVRAGGAVRASDEGVARAGGGEVLSLTIECLGDSSSGSLGARLFDAVETVVHMLGMPESADAAYVWHDRPRSVYPALGDTLRGLDGDITGHLRFADGRSAVVLASNRAGVWRRRLTALCERGMLRVDDGGVEWLGEGGVADRSGGESGGEGGGSAWAVVLAEQIERLMDPRVPPPQPTDYARVLAVTGSMLLSARTGEGESPATLLRMAGRS